MLNRVELIGRLGRDPEIRYTSEGHVIANMTLATSEIHRDKTSGAKREQTEWHRVVLFGRLAEIAERYLKKGSLTYVDGALRTRKRTSKNGEHQFITELVGSKLTLLERMSPNVTPGSTKTNPSVKEQPFEKDALPSIPF
jgi:single-strand DNA-binding protein